eukprot:1149875-Pelagomonas_calceolata.AAC.2
MRHAGMAAELLAKTAVEQATVLFAITWRTLHVLLWPTTAALQDKLEIRTIAGTLMLAASYHFQQHA